MWWRSVEGSPLWSVLFETFKWLCPRNWFFVPSSVEVSEPSLLATRASANGLLSRRRIGGYLCQCTMPGEKTNITWLCCLQMITGDCNKDLNVRLRRRVPTWMHHISQKFFTKQLLGLPLFSIYNLIKPNWILCVSCPAFSEFILNFLPHLLPTRNFGNCNPIQQNHYTARASWGDVGINYSSWKRTL